MTKSEYEYQKKRVIEYEQKQRVLSRIQGKSKCPFCGGTKTKPFLSPYKSQNCTECDNSGKILNKKLFEMDLEEEIEKYNEVETI